MVDYLFCNVIDITKYNPNAQWCLKKNHFTPTDTSSLRPDTIRLAPITESVTYWMQSSIVLAQLVMKAICLRQFLSNLCGCMQLLQYEGHILGLIMNSMWSKVSPLLRPVSP